MSRQRPKDKGVTCVVLAAGLGSRMKSALPKVLHEIYRKPMLHYCLESIESLKLKKTVVVIGRNAGQVKESLSGKFSVDYAVQKQQKGTADALKAALPLIKGTVLVINGDCPLITPSTLRKFLNRHRKHANSVSMLSFIADDPASYGRIERDERGRPLRVIEEKDCTSDEKEIDEVNSGVYAIEPDALALLGEIRLNRKKKEYYLTDLVEHALNRGMKTGVYCIGDESEFLGINSRYDLAMAHEALREKSVDALMHKGVNMLDPFTAFIEPGVRIGADTTIYPNVYIQGSTVIGKGCVVYPNARIIDSTIKNGAVIKDSTVVEDSTIQADAQVGPFAHIRPGCVVGVSAKVGNFVELKNTITGKGSKAMHLSYLGDTEVGDDANIGAGTITCNYDGTHKHRTVIGKGVFVGSDTQLVAPLKIGNNAYIGAGSTITKDVPPGSLATSRPPQKLIKGWARRKKKK